MTPSEWARSFVGTDPQGLEVYFGYSQEVDRLANTIEQAVAAERERCAKIAENAKCMCPPPGCYDAVCTEAWIAKTIREGS